MKLKKRITSLLIITLCAVNISGAVKIIPVHNTSCKYTVCIPDGWDTIPRSILKEKLKSSPFSIDAGIYPVVQSDCFSGNYSLIGFIPTVNMLNRFHFTAIVDDIANMNKSNAIHNDTLHVYCEKTEPVIRDTNCCVNSYFSIVNKNDSLKNCQTLHLTKFGYVSVLSYEKEGAVPITEIIEQLSDMIQIHADYRYSLPESPKGITIKHILISLCIGLAVYVLITLLQKQKKQPQ